MKKRFLAALLALAVAAACLTGCGGENKTEDKKVGTTTQATTTTEGTTTTGETTTTTAETTTAEKTTTTASETTTTTAKAPKQEYYEYDVAGAKIKLRTHIEDYISQDDRGNWEINLKSMAESLGYHYKGRHPDEPEMQIGFYLESGICVTLDKTKGSQDYIRILLCTSSSTVSAVDFARYDSNDESIKTYWITNGGSDGWYKLNYEQIIIYAFLLENGSSSSPYEDWMQNTGIPTKNGSQHIYYVNK